jgi:epidermal growth factor receptor substrate 15
MSWDGGWGGDTTFGDASGKLGPATSLGSDSRDAIGAAGVSFASNDISLIAWVYPNALSSDDGIVFSRGTDTTGMAVRNSNHLGYEWDGAHWDWATGPSLSALSWQMCAVVGSGSGVTAYVDSASATDTETLTSTTIDDLRVAVDEYSYSGRRLDGDFQHVSIHSAARTSAWISHEYDQTNDNVTFWGTWSWETEGGGTTHEVSLADSVGVTDDIASILGKLVSIFDSVSITDDITKTIGFARILSETVSSSDTIVISRTIVRSLLDSVGVGDTLARNLVAIRLLQDSISISDSSDILLSQLIAVLLEDGVSVTDTTNVVAAYVRALADSIDLSDSLSTAIVKSILVADSVGVTDSLIRSGAYFLVFAETVGISDALSTSLFQLITVSLSETVAITDTATRIGTFLRAITDSISLSDLESATRDIIRIIEDSISITDTVDFSRALIRNLIDTVGITDELTTQMIQYITVALSDSVSITDNTTRGRIARVLLQETISATDELKTAAQFVRSIVESVTIDDDLSRRLQMFVTLVDTIEMSDTVSTAFITDKLRDLADAVGITDEVLARVLREGDDWFGKPQFIESLTEKHPKLISALEALIPRITGVKKDE